MEPYDDFDHFYHIILLVLIENFQLNHINFLQEFSIDRYFFRFNFKSCLLKTVKLSWKNQVIFNHFFPKINFKLNFLIYLLTNLLN